MKYILIAIVVIAVLATWLSMSSKPTEVGDKYRHQSTGQIITVAAVGKAEAIHAFIDAEKNRLSYPGRTPVFSVHTPAGDPSTTDDCVMYSVENENRGVGASVDYYIYVEKNFNMAFSKEE